MTKTFADKLPSLQSELSSTQQVDIENYNVSASRLLTPKRTKNVGNTKTSDINECYFGEKKYNEINFKDKILIVKLCVR